MESSIWPRKSSVVTFLTDCLQSEAIKVTVSNRQNIHLLHS